MSVRHMKEGGKRLLKAAEKAAHWKKMLDFIIYFMDEADTTKASAKRRFIFLSVVENSMKQD